LPNSVYCFNQITVFTVVHRANFERVNSKCESLILLFYFLATGLASNRKQIVILYINLYAGIILLEMRIARCKWGFLDLLIAH
jgi:hypothetical protein